MSHSHFSKIAGFRRYALIALKAFSKVFQALCYKGEVPC